MKLVSWNVNGIRAVLKKGTFQSFIKEYKPDVVCLQETKAERGQAEVDLGEYEEYWNSAQKKGYSGTAIFVKKDITVHEVLFGLPEDLCKKYKLHDDSYGDPNTEGRVVAVELDDVYVVTAYTPNSKDDLSRLKLRHKQWDPAFLEYMFRLEEEKPVLFSGDLNVAHTADDLANPKEREGEHGFTVEEREGIDNIIEAGFVDSFRVFNKKGNGFYTYWAPWRMSRERNVGWRIDYWFVSKKLLPRLKSAKILGDVMGSDHCPVIIEIK
ncbi:MAG: Exodeoxyribonuclease III Xth [Parcubacteria group bacterium GW2011_GWA1_53_13]|nr:MAG: Exodeoxyribonuclease III Xth [Parcubacteria group bacterium GW2011_GWA1_53_13]